MAKLKKPYAVKGQNLITFEGEAVFCKYLLKSLDKGQYSPRGQYSVNLIAEPEAEDYKLFVSKVDAIIDQAFNECLDDKVGDVNLGASKKKTLSKASPFKDYISKEKDADGNWTVEVETGKMYIQPKLKNVLDKKAGQDYVKLIGAGNVEVPKAACPEIGNGSKIKCRVYVNPYYMATTNTVGVSFMWSAIKIIELVSYEGGGGEDFDDEEGYTPDNVDSSFDDTNTEGDY